MLKRNYLTAKLEETEAIHEGLGKAMHTTLMSKEDFGGPISFLNYTILDPNATIGLHKHGNDQEIYMFLEGTGKMTVNDEECTVIPGDIVVNPPYGTHGVVNSPDGKMTILVWEVRN